MPFPSALPPRECSLTITSGRKRIGKSQETLKRLIKYTQHTSVRKGRNVIIFDFNNEYGTYIIKEKGGEYPIHIRRIHIDQLKDLKRLSTPQIRRIVPIHPDGTGMNSQETEQLLIQIIQKFRGGCLYIEDFNTVFGDNLPDSVTGLLCNNAHRNADIIITMQSISRIGTKQRQNTNLVRFHYQLDNLVDYKNKLAGDFEIFRITQIMVEKQYHANNIRYFVFIDRDYSKIRGNYSREMLVDAIEDYISENISAIKHILQRKDKMGNSVFSYAQAVKIATHQLLEKYYGN
jgi:hypothetical protein